MKSWMHGLIFLLSLAQRPFLISMIISGQKLHAMPIRPGRSRRSQKGKLPRFVRPIVRGGYVPPPTRRRYFPKFLAQLVDRLGVRR